MLLFYFMLFIKRIFNFLSSSPLTYVSYFQSAQYNRISGDIRLKDGFY